MTTDVPLPVHREDGELIGRLAPNPSGDWSPCTVFGVAIGPTTTREAAEVFLRRHGLDYLAQKWSYRENGETITVEIVEASPTGVTVRFVDYGRPDIFGRTTTLQVPLGDALHMM